MVTGLRLNFMLAVFALSSRVVIVNFQSTVATLHTRKSFTVTRKDFPVLFSDRFHRRWESRQIILSTVQKENFQESSPLCARSVCQTLQWYIYKHKRIYFTALGPLYCHNYWNYEQVIIFVQYRTIVIIAISLVAEFYTTIKLNLLCLLPLSSLKISSIKLSRVS